MLTAVKPGGGELMLYRLDRVCAAARRGSEQKLSYSVLQATRPGQREPCKARPAARSEQRRPGEDTDKLFHVSAERDAAPSDQMRCATIKISIAVGALPSAMQSIMASTNKGLVDRDMLRHLNGAGSRRRCNNPDQHGLRRNTRQTEVCASQPAGTPYLPVSDRRMLRHRHHPCREHGDDRKLGSASARSAECLPCTPFKIMISPTARSANKRSEWRQPWQTICVPKQSIDPWQSCMAIALSRRGGRSTDAARNRNASVAALFTPDICQGISAYPQGVTQLLTFAAPSSLSRRSRTFRSQNLFKFVFVSGSGKR